MSLAFFTQTRTGEIQSRIANDIGGVQTVVTTTATSIVSNVTTVLAATVAMFLLDWRLAAAALGLLPFFVWLTRRVGAERRRITAVRQDRLADMSALVEESLSVSGILLGKTMGRAPELAERFESESAVLADIEVRSRMAGRWRMASVQMSFAAMPALIYLFAGLTIAGGGGAITIGTLVAFTTLQTRLFFPVQSLLSVGVDLQSSLALFERVFHYLDLPVDIEERDGAATLRPADARGAVTFEGAGFRYSEDGPWTLRDIDLEVPAGTTLALVGETGSGKTTLAYLLARLVRRPGGTRRDRRHRRARPDPRLAGLRRRGRLAGDPSLPCLDRGQPAVRKAGRDRHGAGAGGARRADPRPDRAAPRRATRRSSASAGTGSRAARSSASRSPAPSCATRRSWCSTRPPARSTPRPSALCSRRSTTCARGRTTVAIAHRLSTVRDAHQIAVLDRGRVVELGDHDELIAAGGRYAAMIEVQGGELATA